MTDLREVWRPFRQQSPGSASSRPSSSRSWLWGALGFLAVLGIAGCSSDSEVVAPTIELTTTSTSTTVAPTTSSTSQPATSTTEDPKAAILDVYHDFVFYLADQGAVLDEAALRELASDPLYSRMAERLEFYEESDFVIGLDTYDVFVLSVAVNGQFATVESCNLDAMQLLTASGETYIPADEFRYLRTTELELLAQGWRVVENHYRDGVQTICDA